MIISHSREYIFIKSAKTAGSSVEAVLSNFCVGDDVVTPMGDYSVNVDSTGKWNHKGMNADGFRQHDWGTTIRDKVGSEIWGRYFKFSIARNPWDRVVSLYAWKARNDPALRPRRRFYHNLGLPFDELRETRRLFAEFVKTSWQSNDRFYIINGELCVDYMIRYETLGEDLEAVCARIGIPPVELPRLKSGLRSSAFHYSQYYDEESRELVAQKHRYDIELLGYQFETA